MIQQAAPATGVALFVANIGNPAMLTERISSRLVDHGGHRPDEPHPDPFLYWSSNGIVKPCPSSGAGLTPSTSKVGSCLMR
jgi:hypothetical protein